MKILIKLFIFATATNLVFSSASFAGPWPSLETDKEKLEYGLALRQKIPNFFTGTFNYGMEWWRITEDQARVKHTIERLYSPALDTAPLAVITLNKRADKQIPSQNQINLFKQSVLQKVATLPDNETKQNLLAEIIKGAETLQTFRPGELLNQLLHSVPNELKDKAIMKAPIDEKLVYLEKNLPNDLHQTQFYSQSKQNSLVQSKAHGIQLLKDLFVFEKELPVLATILFASSDLDASADKAKLTKAVEHLSDDKFIALQDAQNCEQLIERQLAGKTEIAKQVATSFTKAMQKITSIEAQAISVEVPYLRLAQKPRDIAILRSTTASDCTHTCSFAKPDAPTSRVFFVIDPKTEKEVGYVESEIRASDLGDVLYVSTINGQTITPDQAEELLFMLDSQKEKLGVNKIVVAAEHLQYFMNYAEVINYLEKNNEGKPRIHVESKNKAIADAIDSVLDADYQKEYRNHSAVAHTPDAQKFAQIKTSFTQLPNTEQLSRPIQKNEVFLFALELDSAQRTDHGPNQLTDGERAIVAANLDLQEYRNVHEKLQNRNHLPYLEYRELAKQVLIKYGYDATPEFVNKFPHLFYDGQLAASDASEGQLTKSSFALIAQLLKRGLWHSTWGVQEFAKDQKKLAAFNDSKELLGVLRWASSDVNFHSIQLRNMVLAGIGHQKLKEFGIERELVRLVAHGWSWGQDVSNEILLAAKVDVGAYVNDENPEVREGALKFLKLHPASGKSELPWSAHSGDACAKVFKLSH